MADYVIYIIFIAFLKANPKVVQKFYYLSFSATKT
jgi:hypothetical protein